MKIKTIIGIILSMLIIMSMFPILSMAAVTNPFRDVDSNAWYYNSVQFVFFNGLMNGTSDSTFDPQMTMSRAMVVTVLYRIEGTPGMGLSSFKDVPANQWYSNAVAWASSFGVVNGYSPDVFGPSDNVTREQIATILFRYSIKKGYDVSKSTNLRGYNDFSSISDWAVDALSWANKENLIVGMGDNTLAPGEYATRAQMATVCRDFLKEW